MVKKYNYFSVKAWTCFCPVWTYFDPYWTWVKFILIVSVPDWTPIGQCLRFVSINSIKKVPQHLIKKKSEHFFKLYTWILGLEMLMEFNIFWFNPGQVLVHLGHVLDPLLKLHLLWYISILVLEVKKFQMFCKNFQHFSLFLN